MKIAFILPSLANKGPIIFTHNLIEGLLEQGCYCEVFYFHDVIELEFPVKCSKIVFGKLIDFSGFDVVNSTMAKPDIYLALHRHKIKIPIVASMHCFMKEDIGQLRGKFKTFIYSSIWGWALRRIPNIIMSSRQMLDYYLHVIGLSKSVRATVIPYGIPNRILQKIDSTLEKQLTELKSKYTVLAGCGSLIKRKGFYQLIDYLPTNPTAAVVLIGEGECEEELRLQAEKLGVKERVVFLGFRTNSMNYYPYFDVFCMSSNSEGFGLAMLEAMSIGMPIVCSDLEIYKDYFNSNDISLFEFGNQADFDRAVNDVLQNKEHFIDGALRLFEEKFSLHSMAKSHIDFYKQLIK